MAIITVGQDKDFVNIQAAIDAAQDGDTVLVSSGSYNESPVISGKSIILASEFSTTGDSSFIDQTIIDGGGSGRNDLDLITVTDSVDTQIIGFTIQNGNDGIQVRDSNNVEILNNRILNTVDATDFNGDSSGTIRNNTLENNSDDGVDLNDAAAAIIENNIVRNNEGDGMEIRLEPYSGPTLDVIIRDNFIFDNNRDGIQLIDSDDLSDRYLRIERNQIEGNGQAGLGLMDNEESSEDFRAASIPEPIDVVNNTFVNNDHGLTGGDNLVALNNLFVGHTNIGMKGVDGDSIAAYNLFWNNGTDIQGSNIDNSTTLFADPLLDSSSQLQTGSPAIDAGTAFFEWQGRTVVNLPSSSYSGSAPDLGAFESDLMPFSGADLELSKAVDNSTPNVGDNVIFTLNLTNDGPDPTTNVTVTDLLPSELTFVSDNPSVGTYNNATGIWDVGNLGSGETATLDLTATASTTGTFSNTGEVTASAQPDPDSTPDNGIATEDDQDSVDVEVVDGTIVVRDVRVSASSDDAEERASGNVSLGSSDLELVFDGSNQTVGTRFTGVDIPQGVTITNAYIQFQVDETNTGAANLTIQGEANGDAATFTSSVNNISSRPTTTASVSWTPPDWTTSGEAGPDQRTPDISAVIQEIINQPDWSSGNSLATIITGTGERTAESFDGEAAGAPLLHVEYIDDDEPPAPGADLSLTKEVDNPTPVVGSDITFTLTLNNSGPDPTTNVAVTDLLPSELTFVADNPSVGDYDESTGIWDVGNLGSGETATLDLSANASSIGNFNNTAEVTASDQADPDSTPGNNDPTEDDQDNVEVMVGDASASVIEVRVSSSADDAEEDISDGDMSLNSSDLELVNDDGVDQLVGMRFAGVNIPQGATITDAYLQFQVDETTGGATNLNIRGEDVDNALTFSNSDFNISSRATTDASVTWMPPDWTSRGEAGLDQRTPDISAVIQEIVDRPGWGMGNSLVTIIDGMGERIAESFNGDQAGAPLLHVEYTT